MGLDDDRCTSGGGHVFEVASIDWRVGLEGQGSEAWTEYRCTACDAVSWVGPDPSIADLGG